MTWIKTRPPSPDNPDVVQALAEGMGNYPGEYGNDRRGERRLPDAVMNDSIVLSHTLIPGAMKHIFAAFGAMMDPSLPLQRRHHEMIAATVSALNQCVY